MKELNSQIATTREQSERLLAMEVKTETADMFYALESGTQSLCALPYTDGVRIPFDDVIPAWSLSRLIDLMPIAVNEYILTLSTDSIEYSKINFCDSLDTLYFKEHNNLFEGIINSIEWIINNNHFNKEYLK